MANRVITEDVELGNSGEVSKSKINSNFNNLKDVVNSIDNEAVKIAQLTTNLGFSPVRVPTEQAVSNALKDFPKKSDVSIGMINRGSVPNVASLPASATRGDALYVESESFIYQYDGIRWNKTAFAVFPSDAATLGGSSIRTMQAMDDRKADKSITEINLSSRLDNLFIWLYNSATADPEFQISFYPVEAGRQYQIKGQVSSPLNGNPTGIGAYGFYTDNKYTSGINGTVVRQASNANTNNVVNYDIVLIAPVNAIYFGVTQRKGIDNIKISELGGITEVKTSVDALVRKVEGILPENTITVWGNSITWGSDASAANKCYTAVLRALIQANGYTNGVINCGVGGENFHNIPVRQGGIGFYLADNIALPASASEKIEIQRTANYINNRKFKNTYHGVDSYFSLLVQGETGRDNPTVKTVNPITINGIACTMSLTGTLSNNAIYLNRNEDATSDTLIDSGTFLYPNGARFKQNATVLSIGTNGGFIVKNTEVLDLQASIQQYVDITDLMLEHAGVSKFVICSPYGGTALTELGVDGLIELEKALLKRYGSKFFNWRRYFVEGGLRDAGITPTQEDINAIAEGKVPPSLLSDGLHPNDSGHRIIANRLFNMLSAMGALIPKT